MKLNRLQTFILISTLVAFSVSQAKAVNAPASSSNSAQSSNISAPAASPSPSPTPRGFSPRSLVSFDPAKFGTLTTETLPLENDQRLVARVNGRPVTWMDFITQFEISGASLLQQHPGKRDGIMAALAAPVMETVILQELNRQYAATHNLHVHPSEVKPKLGEIIEQSAGPIKQALQRLNQKQLQSLATDALIREKVEKFIGDEATSVPATRDEITSITATAAVAFTTAPIETLRARHIVIRATRDMSEFNINDARAKAEDILQKIRGGLDFVTAARQYSQDRFTAYLGGDIGYFTSGTMFQEFQEAADALKPGQVSGIVRTPVGFHIIQLTERHPDNLRLEVDNLRRFHAVQKWKQQAQESAKIENYLTGEQ